MAKMAKNGRYDKNELKLSFYKTIYFINTFKMYSGIAPVLYSKRKKIFSQVF